MSKRERKLIVRLGIVLVAVVLVLTILVLRAQTDAQIQDERRILNNQLNSISAPTATPTDP